MIRGLQGVYTVVHDRAQDLPLASVETALGTIITHIAMNGVMTPDALAGQGSQEIDPSRPA